MKKFTVLVRKNRFKIEFLILINELLKRKEFELIASFIRKVMKKNNGLKLIFEIDLGNNDKIYANSFFENFTHNFILKNYNSCQKLSKFHKIIIL